MRRLTPALLAAACAALITPRPALAEDCVSRADLSAGFSILWNNNTRSTLRSSDGTTVHIIERYDNGPVADLQAYRGIFILRGKNPDGSTSSADMDPAPDRNIPEQPGTSKDFTFALTLTKKTGETNLMKTRQRLTLVEKLDIEIGHCTYPALRFHRVVLDQTPAAENTFVYIPELLAVVEFHALSFPKGKPFHVDKKALSLSSQQ